MTCEPTGPLVGFGVIEGMTPLFLKMADAESEDASVAVTVLPLVVEAGTVKVAVNVPELEVVMVGGEVDITVPS